MDKTASTLSNEPILYPSTTELWTASLRKLEMLENGLSGVQRLDELRHRQVLAWERGERLLVEALLADATPPLTDSELLELIYAEVMLRAERGEVCATNEYVQRFPQFAESLQRLFAIHEALEAPDSEPSEPSEAVQPPQVNRPQASNVSRSSDRNLLFGIVALQMDFISRDALIEALRDWTTQKDQPLGQILVERGDLSAARRELLEPLVDEHVRRHDHDPATSLASISSISGGTVDWHRVHDVDIAESLAARRLTRNAAKADEKSGATGKGSTTSSTRFRVLRPHARGAMGEVFLAFDEELHREVALKEIQSKHLRDESTRERFVREAEVTGGLEHPGIVPVYSLGHHGDGRPFYAMRFIRGDSLKEALEQFHSHPKPPAPMVVRDDVNTPTVIGAALSEAMATPPAPSHGERRVSRAEFESVEFRKLLGRFIDVCQAIEYAHSRGVLHRDLKPGNIMLGKYGETLVVDWGLAKAAGKADRFANIKEATFVPSSGSGVEQTQQGSVVGTPSYMSPEQASGKLDQLGPTTDVYSLGATLYHVLTGQPPIRNQSPKLTIRELLQRVQRGDFPPPREINPQIPKPLEAICLKAMSLRPSDRYASTAELAADVERYLADEPVSAHAEPLTIRARRWVKRHQTLVGSTAAAVLVATVTLSVFTVVVAGKNAALKSANTSERAAKQEAEQKRIDAEKARDETRQANTQLAQANTDLEAAYVSERAAKEDADQKRVAADKARDETKQVLDYLVAAFRKSDPDADGEKLTVAELFDQAANQLETTFPNQPLIQAELLNAIGQTYLGLGLFPKAIAVFERAWDRRRNELGENQVDTLVSMNNLATAYQAAGRQQDALLLHEKTLELRKVKLGPDHSETLESMNNLAEAYRDAGRQRDALVLHAETMKLRKAKLGPGHLHTLTSMNNLALAYQTTGRLQDALPLHAETLKMRQAKLGPDHPDTLTSMNNLAEVFRATGRQQDALLLHEETLKLRKAKLGPDHPNTLASMLNLAEVYQAAGRQQDALVLSEETMKLMKSKLGPDHPNTLASMNNLAEAYQAAGRQQDALELHTETLKLMKGKLGLGHPNTLASMNNLAFAYLDAGRMRDALPLFEESLKLMKVNLGPDHPSTLANTGNLASAYLATKQPDLAVPLLRDFLAGHRKQLGTDDPQLADIMASVGIKLLAHEQYLEAEKVLRECLTIREKKLPDDWMLFNTQSMLGGALAGQKKFQEAEPLLLEGYQGMKQREAKIHPADKTSLNDALQRLVNFYAAWEKPEEAAKWRLKLSAPKLDSQKLKLATGDWDVLLKADAKALPQLLLLRATKMLKRGELAHAVQAADKLRELTPKDKLNLYNAACVYARCAEFVTKDKPAPTDAEQAERQNFLNLAIECLKESLAAGWDDFAHLRKDDDLKPLHSLPEFESLFPKKPE